MSKSDVRTKTIEEVCRWLEAARTISEWARIFDMPDGFVERVKRRVDEADERCCFGADNNPLIIAGCWNEEVDR